MKSFLLEDVTVRLAQHPTPNECWLLCDECRRFFQYKNAASSGLVDRDACPFADCNGAGISFDLLMWDDLREPDDPRWPSNVDELRHGMSAPEMASFYKQQLGDRISRMTSEFSRVSAEQNKVGKRRMRYIGDFLHMMSDLGWDLTDPNDNLFFDSEMARELIDQLPVWSRTADLDEAPRMTAELRAFFRFAANTNAIAHARKWQSVLAARDITDLIVYTMQNDRRLGHANAAPTQGRNRARYAQ